MNARASSGGGDAYHVVGTLVGIHAGLLPFFGGGCALTCTARMSRHLIICREYPGPHALSASFCPTPQCARGRSRSWPRCVCRRLVGRHVLRAAAHRAPRSACRRPPSAMFCMSNMLRATFCMLVDRKKRNSRRSMRPRCRTPATPAAPRSEGTASESLGADVAEACTGGDVGEAHVVDHTDAPPKHIQK